MRDAIGDQDALHVDLARFLSIIDDYYDKLDATASIESVAPAALQAAFDNVAEAVLAVDQDGTITFGNRAAGRIFEFPERQLNGVPLARLFPVLAAAGVGEFLEPCLTDLTKTQFSIQGVEFSARRSDGDEFHVEIHATRMDVSEASGYLLCISDITERRTASDALQESEERYRALVENAPEAILVFDVDSNQFVDVNENATQLFNMSRKRLMKIGPEGISPKMQLDGKQSFGHERGHIQRALDGGQPVFEWLHLDADGGEFPCEVRMIRLPSSNRRLIRASITSIVERKKRELLAYGENRVLEMVAGGADLGNTLKAICRTIEQVVDGAHAAIMQDNNNGALVLSSAPTVSPGLKEALRYVDLGIGGVPCAEAINSRRHIISEHSARHAMSEDFKALLTEEALGGVWSFPIAVAEDRLLGTVCVYSENSTPPDTDDLDAIANLVRLAGIAIKREFDEEALRASEQRFRGLFENVVDGVYIANAVGQMSSANPALISMLGYDKEVELTAIGSTTQLYVNPEDFTRFIDTLRQHLVVKNFEVRLRRKDGVQIVVLENARAVCDEEGQIVAYEGTITDITDRKRAETRVFEEKERAQVTLNSIGDGVITTDAEGRVDYVNPVAADLTGWEPRAARGRPVDQIITVVTAGTRQLIDNPVLRCLQEGRVITLPESTSLIDRHGTEIEIQDSTAPIRDRMRNVIGAVMVFHELNKESRLSRQLSYQAAHDGLTGLINRREFENRLAEKLEETSRDAQLTHALLMLDIDQFKILNDTFGHVAGDEYLRQLSDVIQSQIRVTDVLARLGGDEFGVLLKNCSMERANLVAENIRSVVEDFVFNWQDRVHATRVSIGIVLVSHEMQDCDSVLSAADVACFAAKDSGRNRVHVYEQGEATAIHQQMHWAERLTSAVEQQRMELYFQPIVAIGDRHLTNQSAHYELLLRMRDEVGDVVSPGSFIPAAERFGLMPMIDRWVVDKVIDELADREGSDGESRYTLAINLSGNSLSDNRFLDYIVGRMEKASLPEGSICFEITETAAIANIHLVAGFMDRLTTLGCKFSLDDFGSGLSSFSYLKTLPVDFIKIDGSFISNVAHDLMDQSLVSAISQVGRSLGVYTVAEKVESQDVLDTLAEIGVDYAQGFHIARPASIREFPSFSSVERRRLA